jgi:hypothetical protein
MQRATPPPGESFADLFPEPAKDWHPTRNGGLTARHVRPGSITFSPDGSLDVYAVKRHGDGRLGDARGMEELSRYLASRWA